MRDIAKEFDLEAVRMFMLGPVPQPRQLQPGADPAGAKQRLERLYGARDQLDFLESSARVDREPNAEERAVMDAVDQAAGEV